MINAKDGEIIISPHWLSEFERGFKMASETGTVKDGNIYYIGKGIDIKGTYGYKDGAAAFNVGQHYARWKILYDDLCKTFEKRVAKEKEEILKTVITNIRKL